MNKLLKIFWRLIYFNNPTKYARKKGVRIGEGNSFVNHPVFASEPWLVDIGNHNRLSFDVVFLTHDGGRWTLDGLYPEMSPFIKYGTIRIGNNNFIGAKVMINPGVSIGDNNVIAAGSIVTKNVPSGEVWGGIPAKKIMTIEAYREKMADNKNSFDLKLLEKDKMKETLRVLVEKN